VVVPEFERGGPRPSFTRCAVQPLWAQRSYLGTLAEPCACLMLDETSPALAGRNFNEGQSFVTLIDALFKAKGAIESVLHLPNPKCCI